jgi:thiol-disulfide isomerase/thioredoxin
MNHRAALALALLAGGCAERDLAGGPLPVVPLQAAAPARPGAPVDPSKPDPSAPPPAGPPTGPASVTWPPDAATSVAPDGQGNGAGGMTVTGALPGDLVPSFRATVRRPGSGREEPLDSHAGGHPTLYIVNSTTCPYCVAYAERMRTLEAAYMPKGVDVVHVYPNRREPTEEKIAWHLKQGFRGGQVIDADASIARGLDVDKTPTVVLVDAKGVIAYRGAIDDAASGGTPTAKYAADALDAVLAGKPVAVESTDPEG